MSDPAQESSAMFADLKKKKKKKSKNIEETEVNDEVEETSSAKENIEEGEVNDASMFSDIKKKKKKKETVFDEENADEGDSPDEEEEASVFADLKKKKKKKKKKKRSEAEEGEEAETGDQDAKDELEADGQKAKSTEEGEDGEKDYTYKELLSRVFNFLRQNNPEITGERRRYTIAPPKLLREGNKKTIFANISEICEKMRRQPDHLISYLFAELGTSGSVDGNQALIIKGRFQQKQIENILRRYIVEYVTCKTCKSHETILKKENRLFFVSCESCCSTRAVGSIKTGFKAQTEKRSAQRAAAA